MANGRNETLKEACSLLSTIQKQGQDAILQDSRQVAEALSCCISLMQSFHRSIQAGEGPDPASPDWKVVKGILELLVRLGICPYLSPGVGITRGKQSRNSGVLSAASAILQHLSSFAASNSLPPLQEDKDFAAENGILLMSVEILASLLWDRPANIIGSNETEETSMSSLGQLVVNFFLWDMMAAYLQLAFSPLPADLEGDAHSKQVASQRLKEIVERFPVGQMVEASFVMLHQSSPAPPEWLKTELGKQLSKLIMRRGGVAAVLEALVGRATKGNVEAYDKVAAHLAKIPKSITTANEYFNAICPQLLPLLLYSQYKDPEESEISHTALCNMHFTAVSLACKLFSVEPRLAEHYLLEPLLGPLLTWSSCERAAKVTDQKLPAVVGEQEVDSIQFEGEVLKVSESHLVDSLVQLSVLLTASHKDSTLVRQAIIWKTKGIVPTLFKLHAQLRAADTTSSSLAAESCQLKGEKTSQQFKEAIRKDEGKLVPGQNIGGNGIVKGSFEKEGVGKTSEHQSALSRLRNALADIVMSHLNQPVQLALPSALSLLLQHDLSIIRWPQQPGEIWDSLSSNTARSCSSSMYLSRLLLTTENWSLAVALMGELLQRVLDLRQCIIKSISLQIPSAAEFSKYMEDFEILNNEVGLKALEQDAWGAASLVKDLLGNNNVVNDEDILELVLHMVNSVVKGLHASKEADGCNQKDESALPDIAASLNRIYHDTCLCERLRNMAFTLAEESSCVCNTS